MYGGESRIVFKLYTLPMEQDIEVSVKQMRRTILCLVSL